MAVGDRIRLHADIAIGPTHSSLERQINRDTLLLLERQINRDGGSMPQVRRMNIKMIIVYFFFVYKCITKR
jgi:hypothetical protein